MIKNNDIEYENGYLKGKYAQSYWTKKKELKTLIEESQVKSTLFISLGSVVALSQIAEYVFFNISNINKVLDSNPSKDKMSIIFYDILNTFNIDEIELEKAPTLGVALNNIMQSGLISSESYESVKFICSNRNNFSHNYFMKYPRALKGINEMKLFVLQSFYTVLALNQLINEVFTSFKDKTLSKHPDMGNFLKDFNKLFIGEFNGG